MALPYLEMHGARSIDTAVLLRKPWCEVNVEYVARSSEAWVIFPNEVRETISTLRGQWQARGDDVATIRRQLLEIGLPEPDVAFFSELK